MLGVHYAHTKRQEARHTGRTPEGAVRAAASRAAYDAAHTTQIKLKLNDRTDSDIIAVLSAQDNKQGYIKALIRNDIERRLNTMTYNFKAESFGSDCPSNWEAICDYLNAVLCERMEAIDTTDERAVRDLMDGLWETYCGGELDGAPAPSEDPALWYAVMHGRDDSDAGYGSYDYDKAVEMATDMRDACGDEILIAVYQMGTDPVCIKLIEDF